MYDGGHHQIESRETVARHQTTDVNLQVLDDGFRPWDDGDGDDVTNDGRYAYNWHRVPKPPIKLKIVAKVGPV